MVDIVNNKVFQMHRRCNFVERKLLEASVEFVVLRHTPCFKTIKFGQELLFWNASVLLKIILCVRT
jgi:hypothetical protein